MITDIGKTIESLRGEFGPAAGSAMDAFIAGAERVHMVEGNAGLHARSYGYNEAMAERVAKEIAPEDLGEAKEFIEHNPAPPMPV